MKTTFFRKEPEKMQIRGDLLPLQTGFDVVWRGYDRPQVQRYVYAAEEDLRWVTADRDAAVARADALAGQMEAARAEIAALHERIDRISRTPVEAEGLTDRLRRMVELAHGEAAEITERAKAAAERSWSSATQAAGRVRARSEQLVGELDRQRESMESEHRELMDRAHAEVEAMTRKAERRRRELDADAAAVRRQARDDFDQAMVRRRTEVMSALAERTRAAHADADRLVREAREHAQRVVAEAEHRVDVARGLRSHISFGLHTAQQLLIDAEPFLDPLPDEEPLLVIPRQEPAKGVMPTR